MPHNDYVFLADQVSGISVPTPDQLRNLDLLASQSIDGDNGGIYTPANRIIIGGAGVSLPGGQIVGVATGPNAKAGGALILGDNDYPSFTAARTRTTVFALRDFFSGYDFATVGATGYMYDESVPGSLQFTGAPGSTGDALVPLPSHRFQPGGTLSTFKLTLQVGFKPAAVPNTMPGFRIVRIPYTGAYSTTLTEVYFIPSWAASHAYLVGDLVIPTSANGKQFRCSTAGTSGGAQPAAFGTASLGNTVPDNTAAWTCENGPNNPFFHYATLPRPSTTDTYFANGTPQTITMTVNANATIDTGTYVYLVDILDLSATQNIFHSLTLTTSNIASMQPAT